MISPAKPIYAIAPRELRSYRWIGWPWLGAVFAMLHRYRVRYVFVGSFEHRDFGVNAFPLRANFRRVFEAKDTAIYEVLK